MQKVVIYTMVGNRDGRDIFYLYRGYNWRLADSTVCGTKVQIKYTKRKYPNLLGVVFGPYHMLKLDIYMSKSKVQCVEP